MLGITKVRKKTLAKHPEGLSLLLLFLSKNRVLYCNNPSAATNFLKLIFSQFLPQKALIFHHKDAQKFISLGIKSQIKQGNFIS